MKRTSNRWLRIGFLGALCFLAVDGSLAADKASTSTGGSSAQTAAPQEKASIEITESTFNFGEALEGAEVSHDFVVKNTGNAVLQIEQVRPG
jgi:hypothetical protein